MNTMTREIKFRAWDRHGKRMVDWDNMENSSDFTLAEAFERMEDLYIVMQFTGLKDKKGKEIYEADIMKIGSGWSEDNEYVVFFNGKYVLMEVGWETRIESLKEKYKGEPFLLFQAMTTTNLCDNPHLEVIGNVWENPDLLKGDVETPMIENNRESWEERFDSVRITTDWGEMKDFIRKEIERAREEGRQLEREDTKKFLTDIGFMVDKNAAEVHRLIRERYLSDGNETKV